MERIELRAAARSLDRLHARVDRLFGRAEAREHSRTYVRGLLLAQGRKSVEPMALEFSRREFTEVSDRQVEALALQRFLTLSPWEATNVQAEIQKMFVEDFGPSIRRWSLGTVGVIDESSFPKQGTHSVGVARQWCGRLGKLANCQVGVFLLGVVPGGTALLDHQLFLPEDWARDQKRRRETRIPQEIQFQTKLEIASQLLERTIGNGAVHLDWVVADEGYGRSGEWFDWLESHDLRYLIEIPVNMTFASAPPLRRTPDDTVLQARELAARLPAEAWKTLALREGAKGPLAFEFARLRVWAVRHRRIGAPCWLVFRRSLEPGAEIKYYVSNAAEEVALQTLALVTGTRHKVEEFFEDAKGHLGMGDYEARSWTSWHHHMSLVALAHLYVNQVKQEVGHEVPDLTLDLAVRVVKAALDRPTLGAGESLQIIEYHLQRNKIARNSHRKTWMRNHKHPKLKPLL